MDSPNPMVHGDLTPAERHRLAVEEAVSKLTHRCRKMQNARISPDVCAKRKSMKHSGHKKHPAFAECVDCAGALAFAPEQEPSDGEGLVRAYDVPIVCRTCGQEPSAVRFYPSRPNECIACIEARKAERRAQAPKTWSPIEDAEPMKTEAIEEVPVEPEETAEQPEAFPYFCDTHGPHNGRRFGRAHSKQCPECIRERINKTMKLKFAKHDTAEIKAAARIVLPEWIEDWAAEQAAAQGVSAHELVFGLIGEQIPSEWLKRWLLKNWYHHD